MKPEFECECESCKSGCKNRPGWFLPGEAEKAAALLEMTMKEFFDTYLSVDWWIDYDDIFLLAPAIDQYDTGDLYGSNPQGQCLLYQDGLCLIHAEKPYECAMLVHNDINIQLKHEYVAHEWATHPDQIKELLGRKPVAKKPDGLFSLFGF